MNKPAKSFVKGAAILGALGLISKVIGAIYRIPMAGLIGETGMAYYSAAYPVYAFLLAISSAGLPVAISKMVSEKVTLKDYRAAHIVFQTAFKALVLIGLFTSVAMALLNSTLANALNIPRSNLSFLIIAPSLFFVAIISAYRGYFQGLQMMTPTAFSQLIEQVGKLGIGLLFAYLWNKQGPEYGAAGAILGVTLSEVIALVFLLVLYNRKKRQLHENIRMSVRSERRTDRKKIGRQLFILAMPIIIGACAMPLVQTADTAIVTSSLIGMGYEQKAAEGLFGLLTGFVNPLINMPAVLSMALAMSLVPAISASKAENDELGASRKSGMGFKLALLVGLPCAAGFYLLSKDIMHLLFSRLQGANLEIAGNLLAIMALGVLFLTIVQTMTGILQGLGKTYIPAVNLFIGIAVKIAVSLIFIRMPEINVKGAAIGTVACYTVAAVLDIAFVIKYAKLKIKFADNILKPVLAVAGMGAFVFFLTPVLKQVVSERAATVLMITAAAVLYLILIFLFGALKKEDMEYIPGGGRLTRLMIKLKVWKGNQ